MSILSSALFSFGAKAASGLIFGGKEAPKEDSRKSPFQPTRVADVPVVTADELQQRQALRELDGEDPAEVSPTIDWLRIIQGIDPKTISGRIEKEETFEL